MKELKVTKEEVRKSLDVKKIVISYDEYENNKDIYDNLEYIIEVKSKDDLSIDKIINN